MKRLIPVLAIALILTLISWEDASSTRYPQLRRETVQYDHPWGGEQHYTENPPIMLTRPAPTDDLDFFDIAKFLYESGRTFLFNRLGGFSTSKQPTTEIVTPQSDTQPEPEINQGASGGGSGL